MTDLIFSFDTEDYLTPESADAQKWWAEELTTRGVRGSFQLVGEVVRRLKANGRQDVLDAIAMHEICYHTDLHSAPPTHPAALEGKDLAEGIAWVLRREARGLAAILETFGRVPVSYCKPGASWTPATIVALASAGIRVMADGLRLAPSYWYCGMLIKDYDVCFESYFGKEEPAATEAFQAAFEAACERNGEHGAVTLYSHPCRLVTKKFWDVAFRDGANPRLDEAPPAPLRTDEEIADAKDRARKWLDWVCAQPEIRVIDHATYYAERAAHGRPLDALLAECGLKPGEEGRLPLREPAGELPTEAYDRFKYGWMPFPAGFTGEQLLAQGRKLLWTYAQARKGQ